MPTLILLTLVLTQRLEHLQVSLKIVVVGSNPAGYWTSLSSLSVSFSLYLSLSLSVSLSLWRVHKQVPRGGAP